MKKITFPHLFLNDHYLCVTSLEHPCVPRALRCLNLLQLQRTIFELHRFTLATDLNKVVTRSGVWGPHSVREIRFWETHLARLSPTLSFSRSWHKTFFVFRHFTAVCYHRLISLWFSRASNGLEAKWSQDTWTLSPKKISERNANYFWKNYLLAWRAFGSNYKTRVKTEWMIITYYINILLPRRKFLPLCPKRLVRVPKTVILDLNVGDVSCPSFHHILSCDTSFKHNFTVDKRMSHNDNLYMYKPPLLSFSSMGCANISWQSWQKWD